MKKMPASMRKVEEKTIQPTSVRLRRGIMTQLTSAMTAGAHTTAEKQKYTHDRFSRDMDW